MDEYPSSRPAKRRRISAETNGQSPQQEQQQQQQSRATRSSLRDKRTTAAATTIANGDTHVEQSEDGPEGTAPVGRSTRQHVDNAATDANDQVIGTAPEPAPVLAPKRPRGRPKGIKATPKEAPIEEPAKRPRGRPKGSKNKPKQAPPGEPATRPRGRPKGSKNKPKQAPIEESPVSRRSGRRTAARDSQDKTVWDVPTDSEENGAEEVEEDGEDIFRVEAVYSTDGGSNIDGLAAATQLQQELQDTDEPVVELKELPSYAKYFKNLCEDNVYVDALGRFVLEKLSGKRQIPLQGLDSEYQTVYQLLEQTVVAGEGNSMLLLGARGSGKTALVEIAISALTESNHEDFHVVRLNGFLHTDDKIALREIWRQLGRETGTEDEVSKTSSYADTMATLLALLSHPEELFGASEDPDAMTTTKSVIIVLDEFDLFSHHPRQTLLYNLFDIAQARKAPLAVLGLTTKVDVTENLEKRVKSRFSHRYVFLPRPRTFAEFSDICFASLKVDGSELEQFSNVSKGDEDTVTGLKTEQGQALIQGWGTYLQGLWDDPTLQKLLQQIFHRSKCPKDFFASAFTPLSALVLSSKHDTLQIPIAESFASQTLSCPDPPPLPFSIPNNASTSNTSLPLSLLLTATRLTALHDPGLNANHPQASVSLTLSFASVYAEYVRLLTSAKASASSFGAAATPGRIWGKDVAREAWEKLVDWGLVVPVSTSAVVGDARMSRIEISFEEVVDRMGEGGSGALGRWWRDT